jgi:peptidoglycan/xylan/chitin deacetylase (PgdA/CDA1 family)
MPMKGFNISLVIFTMSFILLGVTLDSFYSSPGHSSADRDPSLFEPAFAQSQDFLKSYYYDIFLSGRINSVVTLGPMARSVLAGDWSLDVVGENRTSFSANITDVQSNATQFQSYQLRNFLKSAGEPVRLDNNQSTSIIGTLDITSNGQVILQHVPANITIANGLIMSVALDSNSIPSNVSFGREPIYGLVRSLVERNETDISFDRFPYSLLSDDSAYCKCVVFRLDDVSDARAGVLLSVLDAFMSKNQDLSLGLVMKNTGKATKMIETIRSGVDKGLFELDLHGWDHVNYAKMNFGEQVKTLRDANNKMNVLFGVSSKVFIPPYNDFSNSTVDAMNELGLDVLSSGLYKYSNPAYSQYDVFSEFVARNNSEDRVYHLPRMTGIDKYIDTVNGTKMTKPPIETILKDIDSYISEFGYAIITMHPPSFLKLDKSGKTTNVTDEERIEELRRLIDLIIARDISITTFSDIVGRYR